VLVVAVPPSAATTLIDIELPEETDGNDPVILLQPEVAEIVTEEPGAREFCKVQEIVEVAGFVIS
jgi:hypothetical protein